MTREEQETLEKAVSRAVASTIDAKLGQLYIDREQHFLDHKFVSELRKIFDDSRFEICRSAIRWIIRAVLIAALVGAVVLGRGHLRP